MNLFLIGAGASRGSFEGPCVPTSKEFGWMLSVIDKNWSSSYPMIGLAVQQLGRSVVECSLEDIWTLFDYQAKFADFLQPLEIDRLRSSIDMKKALLTIYGRRCDLLADAVAADSTLFGLFQSRMMPGDVLVSLNYDTIAERVAMRAGRSLAPPPGHDERVTLAKPHGSASWPIPLGIRPWWHESGDSPLDSIDTNAMTNDFQPLMLGAVPMKSELIREVQCASPGVFDLIARQWKVVVDAIVNCSRVIAVGYSFPKEDSHGQFLIGEGLRRRARRPDLPPIVVEFFEIDGGSKCTTESSIRRLFGRGVDVCYQGPVRAFGGR